MQHIGTHTKIDTCSVLKFGGSSFTNPAAYRRIARYIARRVRGGERLCVIVSAMSGTTGRLAALLEAIAASPQMEDRDAVLATGEILAAALVRAAVVSEDVDAVSLNALQLGWRADGDHGRGVLREFGAQRLERAFAKAPVVILAGGQAAGNGDRILMLGRNSSDLTAVAAAASLGCSSVTIFSDVDGVCTADPHKLRGARVIPHLSYELAKKYAMAGAKVLFAGCVEFAEEHNITICCASLLDDEGNVSIGTCVGPAGQGVQVCIDGRIEIWRPRSEHEAAWRTIAAVQRPAVTPVRNLLGYFGVHLDHPDFKLLERQRDASSAQYVSIVRFDIHGNQDVYAAQGENVVSLAQALHDDLIHGGAFQRVATPLSKHRGSHTDIYEPSLADA